MKGQLHCQDSLSNVLTRSVWGWTAGQGADESHGLQSLADGGQHWWLHGGHSREHRLRHLRLPVRDCRHADHYDHHRPPLLCLDPKEVIQRFLCRRNEKTDQSIDCEIFVKTQKINYPRLFLLLTFNVNFRFILNKAYNIDGKVRSLNNGLDTGFPPWVNFPPLSSSFLPSPPLLFSPFLFSSLLLLLSPPLFSPLLSNSLKLTDCNNRFQYIIFR